MRARSRCWGGRGPAEEDRRGGIDISEASDALKDVTFCASLMPWRRTVAYAKALRVLPRVVTFHSIKSILMCFPLTLWISL